MTVHTSHVQWLLAVLALLLLAAPASGAQGEVRILFADESVKVGRVMAIVEEGADLFFRSERDIVSAKWKDLDPAQRYLLRALRLANRKDAIVRDHYRLAFDARRWDLLEFGRRQLTLIEMKWPGLKEVVKIWHRDFPTSRASTLLASGIDALLQEKDPEAYRFLGEIARIAPDTREADLAGKYLRILRNAGFKLPEGENSSPLSRALKLRFQNLQENVSFAKAELKTAERLSKGGSVTQMRNALRRAEETLVKAVESCEKLLAGALDHRARKVFDDLSRILRRELLDAYLKGGEFYLVRTCWTDADRTIEKALQIDPESVQAKALQAWLARARR
jgi:tetratricopeptide (TPR) repeat protein